MVDGSAEVDGKRRLVATWTVDGESRQAAADNLPALVYPRVWWDDPHLFVFGLECPQVDLDLVSDIDQYPVEEVCGVGSRDVVRRLDTGTAGWSTVSSSLPVGRDGKVSFQAGSGGQALLRVDGEGLLLLDTASRDVESLGPVSLDEGSSTEACPVADGKFLLASTTAPPPGPGDSQELVVPKAWLIRDGGVSSIAVPREGAPPQSFLPLDCVEGRGIIGPPGEEQVDLLSVGSGNVLAWERIELPEAAKGVNRVRVQPSGQSVIVWVPEGEGLIPWRQADGNWIQAGDRYDNLDPPDDPVIVGDLILALTTAYGRDSRTTTVTAI